MKILEPRPSDLGLFRHLGLGATLPCYLALRALGMPENPWIGLGIVVFFTVVPFFCLGLIGGRGSRVAIGVCAALCLLATLVALGGSAALTLAATILAYLGFLEILRQLALHERASRAAHDVRVAQVFLAIFLFAVAHLKGGSNRKEEIFGLFTVGGLVTGSFYLLRAYHGITQAWRSPPPDSPTEPHL